MSDPTWRQHCAPIIARVLRETAGQSGREIRRALREAYPFGERAMHPYRVWCDEIRIQRNLKAPNMQRFREMQEAAAAAKQVVAKRTLHHALGVCVGRECPAHFTARTPEIASILADETLILAQESETLGTLK